MDYPLSKALMLIASEVLEEWRTSLLAGGVRVEAHQLACLLERLRELGQNTHARECYTLTVARLESIYRERFV